MERRFVKAEIASDRVIFRSASSIFIGDDNNNNNNRKRSRLRRTTHAEDGSVNKVIEQEYQGDLKNDRLRN